MALKTEVNAQHITVRQDVAPAKGNTEAQFSTWSGPPDQMEKLLPTFAAQAQKLTPGDISAIRDASNEFKRQAQAAAKE